MKIADVSKKLLSCFALFFFDFTNFLTIIALENSKILEIKFTHPWF